ncbi:hypothetical protein [Mucilaginibacter sp. SG564]|uniref:hypothetical protein n=1 Tax=Mucilaginibacter sp. SG564 TaxID=2587022 RepID=UPI001557741F|nr:hypothetical protein [Mucilaginibacter sp. SG564]NOW96856.1 hypothetical protein [Mucilaginibacter sp. SG564]
MVYNRSWPREGQSRFSLWFVFFGTQEGFAVCRHKSNQKGFSRNAFLPHKALALQTGQNHGLLNLTATSFAALQVRFAMPLQAYYPPSFYPLSPEAYLLAGKRR